MINYFRLDINQNYIKYINKTLNLLLVLSYIKIDKTILRLINKIINVRI